MSINVLTNICATSLRLTTCGGHAFSNPRFVTTLKKLIRFQSDFVVKVVGVPFTYTENNVYDFFLNCDIVGAEKGVHLLTKDEKKWRKKDRPAQVAFVELASELDLEKVKTFSTQLMGERKIKIMNTTEAELAWVVYGKIVGSKTKHTIAMIGTPFTATQDDVNQFFSPLVPVEIRLFSSGEGLVDFETHADAVAAMANHRKHMGQRYVFLSLRSRSDQNTDEMKWPAPTR